VVIEGMASRLPVVAAAAGGPAEVIEDGVNGFLTSPGEVKPLARVLRRLADDPELRDRIAAEGQKTSGNFTPERAAEEMVAIYEEILALS